MNFMSPANSARDFMPAPQFLVPQQSYVSPRDLSDF